MNHVAASVMAEAGTESRELIKRTISSLNERLQTLEREARERENELQQKNNEWKSYQVRLLTWLSWGVSLNLVANGNMLFSDLACVREHHKKYF